MEGKAQMDDEEEVMDIVAARSHGDNNEAELRMPDIFELEAPQREDKQPKREEMGRPFKPPQQHHSTTGDNSTGEEARDYKKEDDTSVLNVEQRQIKNHHEVTGETPSAETDLVDVPAFPQPRLTRGQNRSDEIAMHPGAYAVTPGSDLQGTATISHSLVGATSSSDELSGSDSSDEELASNANAMNPITADEQATTPTDNNSGLVVASQVEETEEPTQIARPNQLPGKKGSSSMALMIPLLIGSLLMVGVIVGAICGAGLCSNKESDVETQAPTSVRYFVLEDFQNRIEEAFELGYFPKNDEPDHIQPRFEALNWIVFEDSLQLDSDATNLLQRFIVVLTYFQTSRESDWLDCGPSTAANDEACWIQIQRSESSGSRWLTGVHECQWAGIYCNGEKKITHLQLGQNGLNGPLPTEIARLSALELLGFPQNQLTGTIPLKLFGNKLSSISLTNNSITGTVPTEVGLFDGTNLEFGSNSLSGSIPTELFQTGNGIRLTLGFNDNKLTGTLPTEIAAWHGLIHLNVHLQGNPLHGTIPSEIGLLKSSLREFDISWTNMDGSLPEELFTKCTDLVSIGVSNCGFTGTISTGLQLLRNLDMFDISNNKFHGTIPAQLSALTSLRWFVVNGNDLSGSIPSSVCALADPSKGEFEVAADCLPRDGTGNPMQPSLHKNKKANMITVATRLFFLFILVAGVTAFAIQTPNPHATQQQPTEAASRRDVLYTSFLAPLLTTSAAVVSNPSVSHGYTPDPDALRESLYLICRVQEATCLQERYIENQRPPIQKMKLTLRLVDKSYRLLDQVNYISKFFDSDSVVPATQSGNEAADSLQEAIDFVYSYKQDASAMTLEQKDFLKESLTTTREKLFEFLDYLPEAQQKKVMEARARVEEENSLNKDEFDPDLATDAGVYNPVVLPWKTRKS
ncbi:Leucine rich repeat N-terminal domain [Seminavis robusta]|uniref:Leucine rich repeat N-terminal domain n=1 Tax=Seminavis robusta TaxID=568900 RepID=A0A9N8DD55_9STRA|nr:Leucine rich repeat N-terminal domain [Seminavis robusta]|eukprot:Sro99_g050850.1 Leucine rich repeat N-terminal domain (918) ;mRNA; r:51258-54514